MSEPTGSGRSGGGWRALRSRWIRFPLFAVGGLVLMLVVVGGFTTAVESTNSLEFCVSCHDMSYNFEEYKKTIHYSNPAGVRAVCSDCHVPKRGWYDEMRRKFIAGQDVIAEILGVIDTREKFDARRLEMAKREWARMKESDSIGCRNCHSLESMDLKGQDSQASKKHARVISGELQGKTCIDCHRGIAHKIPKEEDS
jgi:nitrate/TMAO reductase-like tetraheme cytochrome c subunit